MSELEKPVSGVIEPNVFLRQAGEKAMTLLVDTTNKGDQAGSRGFQFPDGSSGWVVRDGDEIVLKQYNDNGIAIDTEVIKMMGDAIDEDA